MCDFPMCSAVGDLRTEERGWKEEEDKTRECEGKRRGEVEKDKAREYEWNREEEEGKVRVCKGNCKEEEGRQDEGV
ncbi:hypothetical protein E2C01_096684 [Portunus trituberculatus]|uniref:Uncharacterized protein n=1 Tax=Portunus trituberculatus TaxID=210409 RepID=A0A5B7K2N5_PORTR|nr:hypothetical protein [Portunus trituberculatus]